MPLWCSTPQPRSSPVFCLAVAIHFLVPGFPPAHAQCAQNRFTSTQGYTARVWEAECAHELAIHPQRFSSGQEAGHPLPHDRCSVWIFQSLLPRFRMFGLCLAAFIAYVMRVCTLFARTQSPQPAARKKCMDTISKHVVYPC